MASYDEYKAKMDKRYKKDKDKQVPSHSASDSLPPTTSDNTLPTSAGHSHSFEEISSKLKEKYLTSSLDDKGVNDWFNEAQSIISNLQNSTASEYSTYSGIDTERMQYLLDAADDVRKYIRANKSAFKNYDDIFNGYTQLTTALDTVQKAQSYFSQFKSEEEYNKISKGWETYLADKAERDASREKRKKAEEEAKANESFFDKLGRWLGGVQDTTLPTSTVSSVTNDMAKTSAEEAQLETLFRFDTDNYTEEQKEEFGRLYVTDKQAAAEYAKAIELGKYEEFATKNFGTGLLATLGSVLSSPITGMADYLTDIAEYNARGAITTKEASPFEYSQAGTQAITKDLNEFGTAADWIPVVGGKGWGDVYGLGTSIAQSWLTAATGGGLQATVSFFGSAAASAVDDALARGASDSQAINFGFVSGVAEAAAEYLPTEMLLGKGGNKGIKAFFKGIRDQMIAEGIEEGATSLLTNIADNIIIGENSQFNKLVEAYMQKGLTQEEATRKAWAKTIEDIAFDALAGAVSGGISGAVFSGGSYAFDRFLNTEANKNAVDTYGESSQELLGEALEIGDADAKKYAEKLQKKLDGGKSLSGYEIRKMVEANDRSIEANDVAEIKKKTAVRLAELGEEGEVDKLAGIIAKKALGESLTHSEKATLDKSKYGTRVSNELDPYNIKAGTYSSAWTDSITTNRINDDVYGGWNNAESAAPKASAQEASPEVLKGDHKVSESGNTVYVNENGEAENVSIKKIVSTEGDVKVELDNGKTVSVKDLKLSSDAEAMAFEMVTRMETTPETAQVIFEAVKASNATSVQELFIGVPTAYRYGKINYEAGLKGISIPNAIKRLAFERGRVDATPTTTEAQQTEQKATDAKGVTSQKKGNVIFEGFKYSEDSATDMQKASMAGINVLAKMSSLEIHVYASWVENGKRYAMVGGKKRVAPNGWHEEGTNKIYIDINAGNNGEGTMLYTFGHEATHYIADWNWDGFKKLGDFLIENFGQHNVPVDILIERKKQTLIKSYQRDGKAVPGDNQLFKEAYEEVVAEAMTSMFTDPKAYEKLAELKKQDKTLWQKLGEAIKKMLDKLKSLLGVYDNAKPGAREADFVAKFSKDVYEQLQDLYLKAFVEADANYQAWVGGRNVADFAAAESTDGKKMFQYRAMEADEETYRDMLTKWGKMSDTQVANLFLTIDKAMDIIKDNLEALDYAWEADIDDRAFSPVKPNSDKLYQVSLDFSTLCRKRILQQMVQAQLQEALNKPLTREEGIAIRDALIALQEEGRQIEVACALCYVESARMKSPEQIKRFMDNKEAVIKEFFAGKSGGDIKAKIKHAEAAAKEKLHKENPNGIKGKDGVTMLDPRTTPLKELPKKYADETRTAKKLAKESYKPTAEEQELIYAAKGMTVSDFTSPEGLENLAKNYPRLFDAYTSYVRNATKSKGIENDTWWRAGDSMQIGDVLIANMNRENGLRSQSWSDFQVVHILDYIAATIELATRNEKEQAYTKVPDYAELMGNTGVMVNLSLIPPPKFNGSLDYDSVEGMDYKRALQLRDKYHATVGTICIGINNAQIKLLLGDITIDYVIPYHKSGMSKAIRKIMHIPTWDQYEEYQSEKNLSRADALKQANKYGVSLLDKSDPNYQKAPIFSEWFDIKEARQIAKMENANPSDKAKQEKYGVMYGGYMAMQNAANNYLKLCAERGLSAKFSHEKADFTTEENYWKLLIDRKMVDNVTGEVIEQQTIKPIFDESEILRILNDELDRYPGVKADQEYAVRKVTEAYLSGSLRGGMSAEAIAKVMKTPVDNVTTTNIIATAKEIKEFDSSKEKIEQNIEDIAKMSSVYDVDKSKLEKTGKRPSDTFAEYFEEWGNQLYSDELGDIAVEKSSIKSEIRHGLTAEKIASIEAIPAVVKEGKVIFSGLKPNSDVQRIVVCAPIKIGNAPYYMGVMLQRDTQTQRLYLHNVAIEKEASEISQADLLTTGADESNEHLFVTSILQNALAVKYQNAQNADSVKRNFSEREIVDISNNDYVKMYHHFGSTKNYDVAGYMLGNGVMLDFSGKHWGDDYSTSRQVDHRDVQEVLDDRGNNGINAMIDMIGNGNIRLMPEVGGINLAVKPNSTQMSQLRGYINHFRGEVVVDIDKVGGDTIHSFEYTKGTSSSKILADIKAYFDEGIVPEQKAKDETDIRQFRYSERVTDQDTLDFLNGQIERGEYITVYRSFQIIDGRLYAPMNAVDRDENGKNKRLGYSSELGKWEKATESRAIAQRYMDAHPDAPYAKFDLDGGDNKTGGVAYNPYLHASNLVLNDQFAAAYRRNLVTVECRVPLSEADGTYKADYAKDGTGWANWKAGGVAGQLKKIKPDLERRLFLSRYMLPVRILSDAEVASMYKEYLDGTDIPVSWNVVTPSLRKELEKAGVNISYKDVKQSSGSLKFAEQFPEEASKVRYQERDPDSISNRSLLANALESAVKNDIERNKLAQYKSKLAHIESEQAKLADVRQQAHDLRFKKGRTEEETKKLRGLDFEANQIANRINTYDRQLFALEATAALKGVLEREKQMAYKRAEQKGKEALKKQRERASENYKKLLAEKQESRQKAIESRHKTEMRHKIKKVVGDLNNLLLHPTKDNHVPIGLQLVVADALDAINMDTMNAAERVAYYNDRIAKSSNPDEIEMLTKKRDFFEYREMSFKDKVIALKNAYAEFKNSDDPLIKNAHNDAIVNLIENTSDVVGKKSLKDMSYEQLEAVYNMYKAVLATVRNANKMFKEGRQETVTENSESVKTEVRSVGGHQDRVLKATKFLKKFGWDMLKPITALKVIGSDTLASLFDNVRAGEDTWAVDVSEAKEFYKNVSTKYGYKDWDFKKRYSFKDGAGHDFSLSLEQIMSLYAYSKRDQADRHLEVGGFIFDDAIEVTEKTKVGIPMKYEVNDANPYRLRREDLLAVIDSLSNEQKGFIDEMQSYLSDVMGAKGNEVSLAMYDIKLYNEKNYFPLKTSRYFREFDPEKSATPKIKNAGFSKKTVPQAGNPIVLSNFMDVWASHVNDMSMYHAFVLPLEDFTRVYNYSSTAGGYDSVQQYIKNAYGAQANQYVERLLDDLNGGARVDSSAGVISKGLSLFKKASVFASASVVVQQPSAIARAFAYVNPKYFAATTGSALNIVNHKELWAEVKKYAPVAVIKEMGYFDTGIGRSSVDWIKGNQTIMDKVDDALAKAPAIADELSWAHIWLAVKREVKATTNLKEGSEEFLKKAGKRFTEVIVNTQVYDSVLSRSGMMRSKDTGMKMATAFMAEPTTAANMMINGIIQGKRGNKKFLAATVGGVSASIVLNSILVALVYGARDDDEDETYAEKYLGSLTSELLDGFNPLTYIPFVKDIWSIAQGYDVERSDMTVVSNLWESIERIFNENTSGWDKVADVSGAVSSLFGIPLKNIIRDAKGLYNLFATITSGVPTTKAGVSDAVEDAFKSSIPLWDRLNDSKTNADRLYEAIVSGDQAQIDRIKGRYKDEDAVESAIRKALRENDPRIKEAAQADFDGDVEEYDRIINEIIREGNFDKDDILAAVKSERNGLEPEDEEDDSPAADKEVSIYTVEHYFTAIKSGKTSLANTAKDDIIKTAIANGKSMEDAESAFYSSFRNHAKKVYAEGGLTRSEAERMLIQYGNREKDDAYWDLKEWDYFKQNGTTDGYSKYNNFYESVQTGRNLKAVIKEYTSHGVEATTLSRQITNYFKPLYVNMSNSERAKLKGYLLNAYVQLGYSRAEKMKDINNWLKDKD